MYPSDSEMRMMLRRASLLGLDMSGPQQLLDLSGFKGDRPRKVPRVTDFGFASAPPAGADFLLLSPGGSSDAMAIGGGHRDHKPDDLASGMACLFDDKGNVIFARGASGIVVKAKEGAISITPAPGQRVYLGGDGSDGTYSPVRTMAGQSSVVMAKM